jgi:dolichol-phosphate mannosyltransferase
MSGLRSEPSAQTTDEGEAAVGPVTLSREHPLVSVVCPAYQEEGALARFHEQLAGVLDHLPDLDFEVLYIDDGSTDGTLAQMRRLALQDGRVRILSFSRNFGKEAALTAGLAHASGAAVITLDTDLQHPPEVIPLLLERWRAGHDVVLTERRDTPYASAWHRWLARGFHRLLRWLSDDKVSATSDYQLLSRRAVDALNRMHEAHRYMRGLVSWLGFPTATVQFEVARRAAGASKFTPRRLIELASDGVLSFSRLPLRLSLLLGALSLVLGATLALTLLLLVTTRANFDWKTHALAALGLVLGGCILCCLGILGEYVGRIYEQVKQRPIYLVKESFPSQAGQESLPLAQASRRPGAAA